MELSSGWSQRDRRRLGSIVMLMACMHLIDRDPVIEFYILLGATMVCSSSLR